MPGWMYGPSKSNCPSIETLGFVRFIAKDYIEIGSTHGGLLDGWLNPLSIPIGSIIGLKKL
jgi:hypothetical protein